MIVLVVAVLVVAVAVLAVAGAAGRRDALAEVERFHRARVMTTSWSRQHVATLPEGAQEPEPDGDR